MNTQQKLEILKNWLLEYEIVDCENFNVALRLAVNNLFDPEENTAVLELIELNEEAKYNAPAMKALHDLTPGGSEFAGDIKRCVEWIRNARLNQHKTILRQQKEIKELRERLQEIQMRF